MGGIARDYSRSSGPTFLLMQGHPIAHGSGKNSVSHYLRLGAGKLTERATCTHVDF